MLGKSLYLFTSKGYSNINMQQIADEIGVSTGTLYHYFSSKEEMLVAMITWMGENLNDYIRRPISAENSDDRFDMLVRYWKDKNKLYEDIMLLAIDLYRNVDIEQWKTIYSSLADRNTDTISERLNISQQFARSIFIYFIGLSFHSLAFERTKEYNKHIDFLDAIFRPMIVDAPDDMEKDAQKAKEITCNVLINKFAPPKTTSIKKNKKTRQRRLSLNEKEIVNI
jgi:AcrR family transcriptional regulator